jgi:formylglycine-generating enzyme required for sulfatase activity
MSDSNLALQLSSPQALVRRMDQQLDLVDRLLAEAEAAHALMPASITNSLGMQMLWCPPGAFLMGSSEDESGRWENENQVQVQITRGFWMARTPVTQGQWHSLMGTSPSHFVGAKLPVESVSWYDAQDFIAKLNNLESLPIGYHYSLPTEAQWEYACRAGQKGPYSGGSLDEVGWYEAFDGSSGVKTCEVGQKKPNAWGLYDMHGNVFEWCNDWYEDMLKGGTDPAGCSLGAARVGLRGCRNGRGGCYGSDWSSCRAAYRYASLPGERKCVLGFRPALVPSR